MGRSNFEHEYSDDGLRKIGNEKSTKEQIDYNRKIEDDAKEKKAKELEALGEELDKLVVGGDPFKYKEYLVFAQSDMFFPFKIMDADGYNYGNQSSINQVMECINYKNANA